MRAAPEAGQPPGQRVGMVREIVDAADARVLERDPAPLRSAYARGVEHGGERVATVQRHELLAERVVGGVQRDGERHRQLELGEPFDAGHDADGRDGEVAGRDADVVVQPGARVEHGVEVGERFAHAHEHDVRHALRRRVLARTTCSTISPAERCRSKPAWPVAQNVQPIAHPACDETQTVARAEYRMSTVSICAPSSARQSHFAVMSSSASCIVSTVNASGSSSARRARSSFGMFVRSSSGRRCT